MYYKVFIIAFLASTNICETYKILLVFPFPFKSHSILGEAFLNLLLEAGHEVSYITPSPVANPHINLRQIVIKRYNFTETGNLGAPVKIQNGNTQTIKHIFDEMLNVVYLTVTDSNVKKILEDSGQTFDLVIAEWMSNDLYSGFSAVFDCPYIWFFSTQNDYEMLRLIHEIPNPSITTNIRTNNIPPLNFLERFQELLYAMFSKPRVYFIYDRLESKAYEELFGPAAAKRGRALPPFEVIRYNASLLFCNSHLTVRDNPVAPQSYKPIGGFHISGTSEPFSQELSDVIESSENGVVLFSLGTFLKVENMSNEMKKGLLAMFSKLNYTILWKIDELFEDLPSNVKTLTWIPLQRVLAHPKCILFITHGGILSITESVHHGVPMIGIPVFGDQTTNVKTIVRKGVAKMVSITQRLADDLEEAINDVLSDPRYKENMRKLSSLYHDRPLSPRSELVHWVEHVAATHGAPHLRSTALLVPWYQKCFIDLAIVILVLIIGILFVIKKLFVAVKVKVTHDTSDDKKEK